MVLVATLVVVGLTGLVFAGGFLLAEVPYGDLGAGVAAGSALLAGLAWWDLARLTRRRLAYWTKALTELDLSGPELPAEVHLGGLARVALGRTLAISLDPPTLLAGGAAIASEVTSSLALEPREGGWTLALDDEDHKWELDVRSENLHVLYWTLWRLCAVSGWSLVTPVGRFSPHLERTTPGGLRRLVAQLEAAANDTTGELVSRSRQRQAPGAEEHPPLWRSASDLPTFFGLGTDLYPSRRIASATATLVFEALNNHIGAGLCAVAATLWRRFARVRRRLDEGSGEALWLASLVPVHTGPAVVLTDTRAIRLDAVQSYADRFDYAEYLAQHFSGTVEPARDGISAADRKGVVVFASVIGMMVAIILWATPWLGATGLVEEVLLANGASATGLVTSVDIEEESASATYRFTSDVTPAPRRLDGLVADPVSASVNKGDSVALEYWPPNPDLHRSRGGGSVFWSGITLLVLLTALIDFFSVWHLVGSLGWRALPAALMLRMTKLATLVLTAWLWFAWVGTPVRHLM